MSDDPMTNYGPWIAGKRALAADDRSRAEQIVVELADEVERLREALGGLAARNGYDGRYVILCDDGSVVSDDEPMDGDLVLVDRGASE